MKINAVHRTETAFLPFLLVLRVAAEEPGPLVLGMKEAIALSLQSQVDVKLARARTEEARARAIQSASALLPQLIGTASQTRIYRENLAAMGFGAFPGIPPLIGPFNVFDARIRLTQELLDVGSLQTAGAARRTAEASSIREELVRVQMAAATALAYIEALRAGKARRLRCGADLIVAGRLRGSGFVPIPVRVGHKTGVVVARVPGDLLTDPLGQGHRRGFRRRSPGGGRYQP